MALYKFDKVEKIMKNATEEIEKLQQKIDECKEAIEKLKSEALEPTYAVFEDGHKERITYFKQQSSKSFEFATEHGCYAYFETEPTEMGAYGKRNCLKSIRRIFCKVETKFYDDGYGGDLRSYHIPVDIDRVEFEVKGE